MLSAGHREVHRDITGFNWTDHESQEWLDSVAGEVRAAAADAGAVRAEGEGLRCEATDEISHETGARVRCDLPAGHAEGHWHRLGPGSGCGWPQVGEVPSVRCAWAGDGCHRPAVETVTPVNEGREGLVQAAPAGYCAEHAKLRRDINPVLLQEGGSQGNRVKWRLTCTAGVYTGKVLIDAELRASFTGREVQEVTGKMMAFVAAEIDELGGYAPPAVRTVQDGLAGVEALMALNALATDADRRIDDMHHAIKRRRLAVIDAVFEALQRHEEEWKVAPALRGADAATVAICRALARRQMVEVFARIGGAL